MSHHRYAGDLAVAVYTKLLWARSDPPAFADHLEHRQHRFKELHYYPHSGGPAQVTREGATAVAEVIQYLRTCPQPSSMLQPELSLHLSGADHCHDIDRTGYASHTGGDGSSHAVRLARYGGAARGAASHTSECMWFGPTQARTIAEQAQQIVADLIVDYGVTTRSHRQCLFDPVYTAIGIANGEHASLGIDRATKGYYLGT